MSGSLCGPQDYTLSSQILIVNDYALFHLCYTPCSYSYTMLYNVNQYLFFYSQNNASNRKNILSKSCVCVMGLSMVKLSMLTRTMGSLGYIVLCVPVIRAVCCLG